MTAAIKLIKKFVSVSAILTAIIFLSADYSFSAEEYSLEELDSLANELAVLVNEAREENGAAPLYVVPYLNKISDIRKNELVNDFEHSSDGKKFSSYIDTSIVDYIFAAENIAYGYDTADKVFARWMESERHRNNILNPNVTHTGVGAIYDSDSEHGWYWEQIFVETDQVLEGQYLPADYEVVPKADGDINGDGVIDSFDYLCLCDYIYKSKSNIPVYMNDAQLKAADCFRDGIITEADAKVMVRYLLGEYKKLPYEF